MLVDQRSNITDLFCDPFPGTSWLLPPDFPLMDQLDSFNREHERCYGTMLKNHAINSTKIPSHLYIHLFSGYRDHDKMFFCEADQTLIGKVPWLVVKSNLYFVPSLWLISSFQTELIKLFPQKDTVFHNLARYLLHPTNQVWGMVTRSYNAYLARADERLGIQVRVFSRRAEYSDNLKNMFWERPSSTGEIIEVYQPSGERVQQTDKKLHNQKALAEMYLLSLTDKLVTSAWSTFGYIAQGLGGIKPWILYKPENYTTPDPPCVRAMSMEPCFLRAPLYGCEDKTATDTGKIVPFVRHCEDWIPGLKLVDAPDNNQLLDATPSVSKESGKTVDKLVGGLLAIGFDEDSCLSRYQSSLYRKPSPYKPSQYLISKLRSYEMLHKRCGPGTDAYKKATKNLGHGDEDHARTSTDESCQYIVCVPLRGLGNRVLGLTSLFLYALLTERVMLVDQRKDISDLFCEPFPGSSWLLPLDFPLTDQLDSFNLKHSRCYGTMLRNHDINSSTIPSHLYLHLLHDGGDYTKIFFCEKDQSVIRKVPWLVVKSNLYFIPSLWLIPSFQTELIKLFPQKDTVFHHLSRYLLHPTNQVWGMVTRSYNTYLARADERLGIQVRVYSRPAGYLQHVMDQIVACTQREKLLPEIAAAQEEESQPSGDRFQQVDEKIHEQKALAEIFLLSLTDKLVTTAWSTFGYVAQGLGGLKPWILYKPEYYNTDTDPPCVRDFSMEPCFLKPTLYGCEAKTEITVPFVRHCEDRTWGVKLVDSQD
ncbi:unnamed protein product [Microthlaspi erraticum]|uniref:Fucosyltransferase n=1 Tax=Microthlaspi erraticum TaxID=1685480 RepID=A0A6D2J0Z5_9BRAS|nr:unnamed protein product [Microthlaspi erraticum]